MLPIASPYRLTIVSFYRHLYTKYIWITYNITYKGSLYFGIPGVKAWPWMTVPSHLPSLVPIRLWYVSWESSGFFEKLCET